MLHGPRASVSQHNNCTQHSSVSNIVCIVGTQHLQYNSVVMSARRLSVFSSLSKSCWLCCEVGVVGQSPAGPEIF